MPTPVQNSLRRLAVVALGVAIAGTLSARPAKAELPSPIPFGNPGDVPLQGDGLARGHSGAARERRKETRASPAAR